MADQNGVMTTSLGGMVPVKQEPNQNIFAQRVAQMLQQAANANTQGQTNLQGGIDTLTNEALTTGGGYNPQASPTTNIGNWQSSQGAFKPAITSLQGQQEALNTGFNTANTGLQTLNQLYGPQSKITTSPGQTVLNQDGTVLYNGVTYGNSQINPQTGQLDNLGTDGTWLSEAKGQHQVTTKFGASNAKTGIVGGVDVTKYNGGADPNYATEVNTVYQNMEKAVPSPNAQSIQDYISKHLGESSAPVTGAMIINASQTYGIDPNLLTSILYHETTLGNSGEAPKNNNPGGVENSDGTYVKYQNWNAGVNATAKILAKYQSNGSTTTGSSNTPIVNQLASEVANGTMGYTSAFNQISSSAYGPTIALQLLPTIKKLNPAFNPNQSDAQANSQAKNTGLAGETSALVDKTNATLDLLPTKFDAMNAFSKLGGSLIPGLAGDVAGITGKGKTNIDDYKRTLAEARASANAVLSTAASLGVVTGSQTAESLLPDGMDKKGLAQAIATVKDLEEKTKKALANLSNASGGSTTGNNQTANTSGVLNYNSQGILQKYGIQ